MSIDKHNISIEIKSEFKSEALLLERDKLSKETKIPLARDLDYTTQFSLIISDEMLSLQDNLSPKSKPIFIDFIGGKIGHRRQQFSIKNQPLLKAIGIKQGNRPLVLDATTGMGQDSFVIAWSGCEVISIERSVVMFQLIKNAIERGKVCDNTKEILDRITLINSDAIEIIKSAKYSPEVIYLDPMYPERKKSALVKKEMRFLQRLVGKDLDAESLLNAALNSPAKKVIVKRPAKGEFLGNIEPNFSYDGKTTRFDVYLVGQ